MVGCSVRSTDIQIIINDITDGMRCVYSLVVNLPKFFEKTHQNNESEENNLSEEIKTLKEKEYI